MKARLWIAVAAVPILGGCSFARQMTESSVSYYSWEHFTLVATLPAKFGFTSKAQYSPKAGESCQMYSPGLGGSVTRQQQRSHTTVAKDVEQTVSTDIPLEFHIADCSMELSRVIYEVNATYGPDAWDHGLDIAGGLSVRSSTVNTVSKKEPTVVEQKGLCSWLFQISKSKAKLGEVEKILSCNASDDNWSAPSKKYERRKPRAAIDRNKLASTTVKIEFHLSNEERPAVGDTWQKVPEGWKPCLGNGPSDPYGFCRGDTRNFRTFKMNKRKCTIYPNCVELGVVHD
ncbi:hypothetical protein KVG96_09955 [Pseudomonas sp. COR58]|uniref:Lipoprotein n=1 Tax=Pseudomonas ekonensis TaxID=2842353 RepID=A0ABS6PCS9_9PSED|nr:hypothetical protein [Pseudomonas ekonensis]